MLQINLKFQETDQGHIFDAWESLSDIERDLAAAAGPRLQPLPNQPYKNLVLLPDKIMSDEIKALQQKTLRSNHTVQFIEVLYDESPQVD